jgi:hypothetical protein
MKVIIAGSRTFDNYLVLKKYCDKILSNVDKSDIEIVSGGARGADFFGEKYAQENSYGIKLFPANWDKYGKSAGYIRNQEMAKYADALIAFWDGTSRGTKHMIDLAKKHDLKVRVYKYGIL